MIIQEKNIDIASTILLSTLIAVGYFLMHQNGYYDTSLRIMAAIGLIPSICMAWIAWRTKDLPIVVYFMVLYQTWNMFLEPYTWQLPVKSIYRVYSPTDFPMMAFVCLLSIFALFIGFLYGMKMVKTDPMFEENRMNSKQIEKLLIYLMIGGSILGGVQGFIPLGFLDLIDTMLPATVGGVFLLFLLRGGRNSILTLVVILYMIYYFIYYVGGTLFIYSIFLVLTPVVIYIIERKKIPYIALTVVVILLLPVYMSRHAYRNEGLYSTGAARMAVGTKILTTEYSNISYDHWKKMIEVEEKDKNIDNRTEGVSYLASLIQATRSGKRFLYGETLAWLPTMALPRFLIPFRPGQNMGDQWAVYYGLKKKSWKASINFPMLCEFYVNFGYLGMIVLMFFNGWLIVWFLRKLNEGKGDTNLILLVFVITKIIVVESNVTLSYGAIIQVMVVCWLLKKYFKKGKMGSIAHYE